MAAETQSNHGTTETTEAEGHGGGGLPQLQMDVWAGQIIWLLAIFIVLYIALSRVFTPRIRKVLDERSSTIETALATARQVQAEAEAQARAATNELAEARAQAQRVAAEARAKTSAESAERAAVQDAKVAEQVAAAEARIAAMRENAMANVGAIADDAAKAIVEKLTGRAATAAEMKAVGGAA